MPSIYGKRTKPMPPYARSEEEDKWYKYCVRNNIRISPYGIQNDTMQQICAYLLFIHDSTTL